MSKLPVVKATELVKYLIKKGFVYKPTKKGGDHRVFTKGNKWTTVPVRKNNEIGKGLLETILAEAGIEIEEFKQDWHGKKRGGV